MMKVIVREKVNHIATPQTKIFKVVIDALNNSNKISTDIGLVKGDLIVFRGEGDPVRFSAGSASGKVMTTDPTTETGWTLTDGGGGGGSTTLQLHNGSNEIVLAGSFVKLSSGTDFVKATSTDTDALFVVSEDCGVNEDANCYSIRNTICMVRCTSDAVAVGDSLTISSTAGTCEKRTVATKREVAIALTAKSSGSTGTVKALLREVNYGVLDPKNGGTGQTKLDDAGNAIINALSVGNSNANANDYMITQYAGGGQNTYHRRAISKVITSANIVAGLGYTPVNKAGDTITGNLTLAKSNDAALNLRTTNGPSTSYVKAYADPQGSGYGNNVVVYSGGNMIVGGGESASSIYSNNVDGASDQNENLHLGADGIVYIYSNCNTIGNRKKWKLNTDGTMEAPAPIHVINSGMDATASSRTANQYSASGVQDSSGKYIAWYQACQYTDGMTANQIAARKYTSSSNYVDNALSLRIDKNGNRSVAFSDAGIWRTALGLGSLATESTVPISKGGTGATTRLNAVKNLTDENVGTNAQYFLTITQNWGKAGFTKVADVKTVLGIVDSGWQTLSTTLKVYYRKIGNVVHVIIDNPSLSASAVVYLAGILPSGYRPYKNIYHLSASGSSVTNNVCAITSGGAVNLTCRTAGSITGHFTYIAA